MEIIKSVSEVRNQFPALYGCSTLYQINRYSKLLRRFNAQYKEKGGYMCSSSGRVEVIGNHTDHNGGKVVACAISLDILAVFLPDDEFITIKSEGYPDIRFRINELEPCGANSQSMAKGVIKGLLNRGYKVGGFKATITSNVVGGAGISSSAAYELLICEIENGLYNNGAVTPIDKAKIGQFSENNYFGKASGLMDQSAVALGGMNIIDFKDDIKFQRLDIDMTNYNLVLINTGGSHANLTEEYSAIPKEMFAVAKFFGKTRLIDVDKSDFYTKYEEVKSQVGLRPALRAKHFFEENDRVNDMQNAVAVKNYDKFLQLISQSGESSYKQLQNCYVVGGAMPIPECLSRAKAILNKGACRVHGGGFAGTTLNIVPKKELKDFISKMLEYYSKKDIIVLKLRSVGATTL